MTSICEQTWLVGDGLSDEEQLKAPKGTSFIPYSMFPPKKYRKDCFYLSTPAMKTPISLENVDSCEVRAARSCFSHICWLISEEKHMMQFL